LIAGIVAFIALITLFSLRPPVGLPNAPIPVENLSPSQLHSLYQSEVAFNVTGDWNVTITASPGQITTGGFALQVYKQCKISVQYSPYRLIDGANVTAVPSGTNLSLSVLGQTNGMVLMPSNLVLNAVTGTVLHFNYSLANPATAAPGFYFFQLVLLPQGSSYLARFFDVNLIVN
jgi:hypothetical protein